MKWKCQNRENKDCGARSVNKALAGHAWEPEFGSPAPTQNSSVVVCTCYSSAEELEKGKSQDLSGQQVQLKQQD